MLPNTSTRFPYTTLFRSSFYAVESNTLGAEVTASYGTTGDSEAMTNEIITTTQIGEDGYQKVSGNFTVSESGIYRSEEHTSELQSRGHLVCRHLLVKKHL